MRRHQLTALLALALALPAGAQKIQGILVEPANPTSRDRIELTVVGTQQANCPFVWKDPESLGRTPVILLQTSFPVCPQGQGEVPFRRTFEIGPLPAGTYYAHVEIKELPHGQPYEVIRVTESAQALQLGADDSFHVQVHWKNPRDGSEGGGYARRLAEDSGAFWFFTPDNLEVTVKILDGRGVNRHWWVFIASMTDLEMTVTVVQEPSGPTRTYTQAAGQNRNFIDVGAFSEGGEQ